MTKRRNPKHRSRIYWREQGGARRAYGDFRDVGGSREALVAPGDTRATTDAQIAERLAGDRLKELQAAKRDAVLHKVRRRETLQTLVSLHLVRKAQMDSVGNQHLAALQQRLDVAIAYFGANRDPASILPEHITQFSDWLLTRSNRRKDGGSFSGANARQYLTALSGMFKRAVEIGCVPTTFVNPVSAVLEKPQPARHEAEWLEIHDAALLLEAARTFVNTRPGASLPFTYALIGTLLLTGGREKEVLGLEADDVSFDRGVLRFQPNQWRGLKTRKSRRTVPLWPQLREILQAHMYGGETPRVSGLLFPSPRTGRMIRDIRKQLDSVANKAGWKDGEIRSKMLRHTYCSARLQTADRIMKPGAQLGDAEPFQWVPVPLFTVSREMGHSTDTLVREVYGHLGNLQHRSDVVEYRVEQHRDALGDRLLAISGR